MNITKLTCLICHYPFDDSIHLPRIMPKCEHTICSLCISKRLLLSNKTFICPKDNIIYSKVESIDYFKINNNILEKIKEPQTINNNTNNNISLSETSKLENISSTKTSVPSQKAKIDTIPNKDFNILNNTLISSINNNQQCYIKKIIKFEKKFNFSNDTLICSIHSLPLNIICVNDRQKICSQCALNDIHLNHQIIPENKFIEYFEELMKVYQQIESNINKYSDINNINSKLILQKIEKKINQFKNNINHICGEIIENINMQCKQIEKYLDLRKKEIFNKYQYTNYDINNLRESTNNWVDTICDKLASANSGNSNELSIECLKLLDNDTNKNIFSLINLGKQLNERYNFINETEEIINKLNDFNNKGLIIHVNKNVIESINSNFNINNIDENENKKILNIDKIDEPMIIYSKWDNLSNINNIKKNNNILNENNNYNINNNISQNIFENSLFKIEENIQIIDSLHLTPISLLFKQTNNIFITYENEDPDNGSNSMISNISSILPQNNKMDFDNNINNIFSKKNENSNNDLKNEYILTFKNDNSTKSRNNFLDYNNFISNRSNLVNNKENKTKNKLSLSAENSRTCYEKKNNKIGNISLSFKRLFFPKLLKVKTCDEVFIAANKRKKSRDEFDFNDINNSKFKYENTSIKLPMSPKLKTVYNIISKNMKMNNIYLDQSNFNNETNKNKRKNSLNKKRNNNNDSDNILENEQNKESSIIRNNNEKEYKTKYVRCVSCSTILKSHKKNKNSHNISAIFDFKSPIPHRGTKKIYKNEIKSSKGKDKDKDRDRDKDSDISSITSNSKINMDNSQYSHHLNRSCGKQNSKIFFNLKNKRNYSCKSNKKRDSSFINKTPNELQKLVSTQMKKTHPIFNRINMSGFGILLICNYFQKNQKKKYKEMKLTCCNLIDTDFYFLVKNIIENEIEIPILNLSYNKISDNSSKYMLEIIKKKNCLKNIFLYSNTFSKTFTNKIKNYNKDKDFEDIKFFM